MPDIYHCESSLLLPLPDDPDANDNGEERLLDIPLGCELTKVSESDEPDRWKMSVMVAGQVEPQIVLIDPDELVEGSIIPAGIPGPVAELFTEPSPEPPLRPVAAPDGSPTADATPSPVAPLAVGRGQVTFDAEGNDVPGNRFFSRVIHWPGNAASGVTLGRGYDMGSRSQGDVSGDLEAAGLGSSEASRFAEGAGRKGDSAKSFVLSNRDRLGEISREAQNKLFELIYPRYLERGRRNYENWTANEAGRTDWNRLHPAIRDIMVDFAYQGFTRGPRPMQKGMRNDFDELITYIRTNETIRSYERGRRRAAFLEAARRV